MVAAKPYGFRPTEHLRRPQDFRRVYERRRSASDECLIVYACPNGLPQVRLGLSVSKKHGGAVFRNRLRRLYREAFRLTQHQFPKGLDLVVLPRSSREPTLDELMDSLPRLVSQIARRLAQEAPLP